MVAKLRDRIKALEPGDNVLVTIPNGPYKCPPAPFEFSFIIDHLLRERGIREKVDVALSSPRPFPFGGPPVKKVFMAAAKEKDILYLPEYVVDELYEKDGKTVVKYKNGEEVAATLVLGPYTQKAPAFLKNSGLTNEKGFVEADLFSLKSKVSDDIFVLGDCAWLMLIKGDGTPLGKPHPKSGTFAAAQAKVVGRQLASPDYEVSNRRCGKCFAEAGKETGITLNVTIFENGKGPPSFVTGPPDNAGYKEKLKWINELMEGFFDDPPKL